MLKEHKWLTNCFASIFFDILYLMLIGVLSIPNLVTNLVHISKMDKENKNCVIWISLYITHKTNYWMCHSYKQICTYIKHDIIIKQGRNNNKFTENISLPEKAQIALFHQRFIHVLFVHHREYGWDFPIWLWMFWEGTHGPNME